MEVKIPKDDMLGNPTRLSIMLHLLIVNRATFSDLQKALNLTPGNLDSHLRKLEKAGLIRIRKGIVGLKPRTIIMITDEGYVRTLNYIRSIRETIEKVLSTIEPKH